MACQRSDLSAQPIGEAQRTDLWGHASENLMDLGRARSGSHHGLHRSTQRLGEGHVRSVEPASREAPTACDRPPDPRGQAQFKLDREVREIVAKEATRIELDRLAGTVAAFHSNGVALIRQLDEHNLHARDGTGTVQLVQTTLPGNRNIPCAPDRRLRAGETEVVALGVAHPSMRFELLDDRGAKRDQTTPFAESVRRLDVDVHRTLLRDQLLDLLEADLE